MKFAKGTKFISRGKTKIVYTVKDHHTTRNSAGEIVRERYLCEHEFLGQKIQSEEAEATIARGIIQ